MSFSNDTLVYVNLVKLEFYIGISRVRLGRFFSGLSSHEFQGREGRIGSATTTRGGDANGTDKREGRNENGKMERRRKKWT